MLCEVILCLMTLTFDTVLTVVEDKSLAVTTLSVWLVTCTRLKLQPADVWICTWLFILDKIRQNRFLSSPNLHRSLGVLYACMCKVQRQVKFFKIASGFSFFIHDMKIKV